MPGMHPHTISGHGTVDRALHQQEVTVMDALRQAQAPLYVGEIACRTAMRRQDVDDALERLRTSNLARTSCDGWRIT